MCPLGIQPVAYAPHGGDQPSEVSQMRSKDLDMGINGSGDPGLLIPPDLSKEKLSGQGTIRMLQKEQEQPPFHERRRDNFTIYR